MDSLGIRMRTAPQIQYPRAETFKAPGLYPSNVLLHPAQFTFVGGITGALSAFLARPMYNLHQFTFLSLTPHHLTAQEKQRRFEWQIRNTKWLEYPVGWQEHWFSLFFPFVCNAVLHQQLELWMGRDKKNDRQARLIDERYKRDTKVGYIVPIIHTHAKWGWALDGFISGAATGVAYTAVRHPYDVMKHAVSAPDAPRRFTGVRDVAMTILQHKPSNVLSLYKGFNVAAVANVAKYSTLFGTYHMWKYEVGNGYHWAWFWCAAHVSASMAAFAHYPWEQLRWRVVKANQKSRFSKISAFDVLAELRRTTGPSVLLEGMMLQRPFFLACGTATMMTMFDYASREVWAVTTNRVR